MTHRNLRFVRNEYWRGEHACMLGPNWPLLCEVKSLPPAPHVSRHMFPRRVAFECIMPQMKPRKNYTTHVGHSSQFFGTCHGIIYWFHSIIFVFIMCISFNRSFPGFQVVSRRMAADVCYVRAMLVCVMFARFLCVISKMRCWCML